jgi:hypothetical protein
VPLPLDSDRGAQKLRQHQPHDEFCQGHGQSPQFCNFGYSDNFGNCAISVSQVSAAQLAGGFDQRIVTLILYPLEYKAQIIVAK